MKAQEKIAGSPLMTDEITQEVLDYIRDRIVEEINPKRIMVFGSYARDEFKEGSDLDLLILVDDPKLRKELYRKINKLLFPRTIPIDIVIQSEDEINRLVETEHEFYLEISENNRTLYERN